MLFWEGATTIATILLTLGFSPDPSRACFPRKETECALPGPKEKVAKDLEGKLSKILISQKELTLAENALRKTTTKSAASKLIHDKIVGLRSGNIQALAAIVAKDLVVVEENEAVRKLKSAFEKLELAHGVDSHVEELELDVDTKNEFKCIYGYITAYREDNVVHVAYAIHMLEFKINMKEGMTFNQPEVEAIRNHYSKDRALKAMKQENII